MNAKTFALRTGHFATKPYYRILFGAKGMWQENTKTGYRRKVRRQDGTNMQYTTTDIKTAIANASKMGSVVPKGSSSLAIQGGSSVIPPKKKAKGHKIPLFQTPTYSQINGGSPPPEVKAQWLPIGNPIVIDGKAYRLGVGATKKLPKKTSIVAKALPDANKKIADMLKEEVQGVEKMRGQRGELSVTQMLQAAYRQGLFMHGSSTSPVNKLIVPALRHIMLWCSETKKGDPKRKHILNILADACLDCQQVQAREILRTFRELTNQAQTLESQILEFLNPLKEEAVNALITAKHSPLCDLDHTKARPFQQRPHLRSAYVAMCGDLMAMSDTLPSKNDRFLYQAQAEVSRKLGTEDARLIAKSLIDSISVKIFFQGLLADINNQSKTADRSISPKCLFDWAKENLDNPHSVFYEDERADDFKGQTPAKPNPDGEFNPFLSRKVLVEILMEMKMIEWDPDYKETKPNKPEQDQKTTIPAKAMTGEVAQFLQKNPGKLKQASIDVIIKSGISLKTFATYDKIMFLKLGLTAGQAIHAQRIAKTIGTPK
uniref:Uncharacterized protein n=1 Tax=Amorphochlora amoebiformis TaxID=1561963 RepID=A0A7S0DR25_9EUKA